MGLNLTERSSGMYKGKLKISKRGSSAVRYWMYLAAPLAIGGFWVFSFIRALKSRPVMPSYDPQMEELLEPEHATA